MLVRMPANVRTSWRLPIGLASGSRSALLGFALLLAACAGPSGLRPDQPEAASGFDPHPVAQGRDYMAVTANQYATRAAAEILEAGGSAVDAAIAAQFVLNLVEPQSSGIGGGGFMLAYDAGGGRVHAYDGRETAPSAAVETRFVDPSGRPQTFYDAAVGGKSVGVPGLVAMLKLAHARHGKLAWSRLAEPAISLAERGYAMSARLHTLLEQDPYLKTDPGAREIYYRGDGRPLGVGMLVRNPRLAAVLRGIARDGGESLYRGALGQQIVQAVRSDLRNPGDLAAVDLANYRAKDREPVCGSYRDYRICGMPPPSSGGIAVVQLLGILERLPRTSGPPLAIEHAHRFAEAGRLVFADRGRYLADPEFVDVPVSQLLAPRYLDGRASLIRDDRSMGTAVAGQIAGVTTHTSAQAQELPATTHVSIVDRDGNAVAMTTSIEDAFGSRIMVDGFLLNNQLTDFAFVPRSQAGPAANRVGPGKRPLSSMSPTLMFGPRGELFAVVGSPGGARIINYVAQAIVALIDGQLSPGEVVALPHVGSRNGPTELEAGTAAEALEPALRARGHEIQVGQMTSGLHLVVRAARAWIGAADPRREGMAAGR